MVPGSSACANTNVKCPSSRRRTARTGRQSHQPSRTFAIRLRDGWTAVSVSCRWRTRPRGFEFRTQGLEILDDAVVHYGEFAGSVSMRMSVTVGGPTVSRPARVCRDRLSPFKSIHIGFSKRGFGVGEPTGTATNRQTACGRRVAPCLRSRSRGTPFDAMLRPPPRTRTMTDVSDDSAHSQPG